MQNAHAATHKALLRKQQRTAQRILRKRAQAASSTNARTRNACSKAAQRAIAQYAQIAAQCYNT